MMTVLLQGFRSSKWWRPTSGDKSSASSLYL